MSHTGRLLVASPLMGDPNFAGTVILVCSHDPEGAFGVVLNRPTDLEVAEHLPEWAATAAAPAVVFLGGPVQIEVAIGIAAAKGVVAGWTPVSSRVGVIDLASTVPEAVSTLRVFAGYAGWGPNQLDAEVDRDDWFVIDAVDEDVFTPDPAHLRRLVLRRQPDALQLYANYPTDPRAN